MSKSTALSRFQILNQNQLMAPGKCSVCGTCQGTFIDIGLDLDFYGVVYFCLDNCVREMANNLEYYSPSQWKSLKELNKILMDENNELKDEIGELRNAVGSLSRLSDRTSGDINTERSMVEESSKKSRPVERSNPKSTERKTRPTKQNDESGSTDVSHTDSSLDEFLGNSI